LVPTKKKTIVKKKKKHNGGEPTRGRASTNQKKGGRIRDQVGGTKEGY